MKFQHSIREQRLEIEVASEALALALQPRLEDFNRRYFLPVIERVFDELAVPGRQIRIDKLKVNLGRIPYASFEQVAGERLYRELRQTLEELLLEMDESVAPENRWQSEEATRLELMEHYLLTGTLPFWATRATDFSLEESMRELAEADPRGLVELIRKQGRHARVRERLLLQLGEESLRRLLHLLEPEQALLIISYLIDLRGIHRVKPVLKLTEKPFARLLWSLVLAYVAQDPGSQFNRRSFLKSLLEGMSESEGLEYAELLNVLYIGLQQTEKRHSLASTLPTVIRELAHELHLETALREAASSLETLPARQPAAPGDETPSHPFTDDVEDATQTIAQQSAIEQLSEPAIEQLSESAIERLSGEEHPRQEIAAALASLELYLSEGQLTTVDAEPQTAVSELRGLLRWLAARDALKARLLIWKVARLTGPGLSLVISRLLQAFPFEDVLALIEPQSRAFITAFVKLLSSVRARAETGGPASRSIAGDDAIMKATLEFLLKESTSRVDVRDMVRDVMESVAWREGVSTVALAAALEDALKQTAGQDIAGLQVVRETIEQLLRDRARAAASRPAWAAARPAFTRYDQAEILRYYFRYGVLPWWSVLRDSRLTAQSVLVSLPSLSRSLLRAVFPPENPDEQLQTIIRAAQLLPEESLMELLRRLFHQAKEAGSPFWSSLSAFAIETADNAIETAGKRAFYARLIAANLNGLPIDLEALAALASARGGTASAPAFPDDLARWDAHALKSALAHRLRFAATPDVTERSGAELLSALMTTHPNEARLFLDAVRDAPDMLAALAQQSPPPLFDHLLELLNPFGAEMLRTLMRSVAAIPTPYRPGSEENLRQVILTELLQLKEGEPLDGLFFARVLRRLFGASLPEPAAQFLLQEAAGWSASERLPKAQVAAFEAAIKSDEAWAQSASSLAARAAKSAQADAREPVSAAVREAVFAYLRGENQTPQSIVAPQTRVDTHAVETLSDDALAQALLVMFEELPEVVEAFIRQHQSDQRARERWAEVLPEPALVRLSYLMEPQQHRILIDTAEVLASALSESVSHAARPLAGRESHWRFLLEFLAHNAQANRSAERLVAAFFEYFAARYQSLAPGDTARFQVGAQLLEQASHLAREAGQASLLAILHRDRKLLLSAWSPSATSTRAPVSDANPEDERQLSESPPSKPAPRRAKMAFSQEPEEESSEIVDVIYINNAGLVLTSPFLPHLFQTLNLLHRDENGSVRMRDVAALSRAVHLLQYLVDGTTNTPEPLLVLNKIMCGALTATPVELSIVLTEQERELCERLLKAMIANWPIISNTSVAGLRETFLQREGKLEHSSDGWRLRVQRKTLDVLVDQVPWSISIVYHNWMPQPLSVNW
ncbi:MAG TPA: contractile injection system tape measure protein [Pyrinomonadaceae bacterium]